jgi:hypothetical protein
MASDGFDWSDVGERVHEAGLAAERWWPRSKRAPVAWLAFQVGVMDRGDFRRLSANRPTRAEFMEAVGWEPMPDLESVRVPRARE